MSSRKVAITIPLTAEQLAPIQAACPEAEIACWPEGLPAGDATDPAAASRAAFLREAEALVTARLSKESLVDLRRRAPALRWVQFPFAGVEPAVVRQLHELGITVSNASGVHAVQIAEYAVSALLLLAKGWPEIISAQREREWIRPSARELYGATLCIVGLGRVGGAVARLAAAFGMRVTGVRRRPNAPVQTLMGPVPEPVALAVESGPPPTGSEVAQVYGPSQLGAALGEADYVLNALPATPNTESFFDASVFALMKPQSYFVNIGRGGTVDDQALAAALASGRLAGAVLDVFRTEPLPADSPLWATPNLVVSPHISGGSPRYMDRASDLFAENLRRFLAGEPVLNVVDPERGY